MTFRRFAVSLVPVCLLLACSNDDAVIALNVSAGSDVPVVDQLHVTVTQGSRNFVYDFKPPTEKGMGDAGPSIQDSFFERITLPESFTEDEALVHVEALRAAGVPFNPPLSDETKVRIEEHGVVAAFVSLKLPSPPPPVMGGDGGAAGAAGAGGEAGEAGAKNEGGAGGEPATEGGASSVEGGAAGADAAGAGAGG
jgi:hypothetical protein